jgi:hypothetical protein
MACSTPTGNPGMQFCTTDNILVDPIGLILTADSLSFTAENFLLQTAMNDAVEARTAFPIMGLKDFVENSTDTNFHEYTDETRKFIRQGKYRFQAMFEVNECVKKELQNFNNFRGRVIFVYEGSDKGVLRGSSIDGGTTVKGARIQQLVVVKETLPTKDGVPAMITVEIDLKTSKDLNQYDHAREVDYDVWELDSLTEVDLAQVGAASVTAVTISVNSSCYGVTNPISGLVVADFVLTGTGALVSVTEPTAGNYLFVTTTLTEADSINLVAPTAMVADLLILSSGPVVVTVT